MPYSKKPSENKPAKQNSSAAQTPAKTRPATRIVSTKIPPLATSARVGLPGSERPALPGATSAPSPTSSARLTVSVIVKRKAPLKTANRLGKQRLTRTQYRQLHSADLTAVKLVHTFAKQFGLAVLPDPTALARRTIQLSGSHTAMQQAFGVTFEHVAFYGTTYRIRQGSITLPAPLIGLVEAVLGLDNRPQAQPRFRIAGQSGDRTAHAAQAGGFAKPHVVAAAVNTSYTPVQVAQLYQFPANASAAGQTIGIIELGGGYTTADLTAYFQSLGQKAPSVTAVSVDGGKNTPSTANSADGEVMLDIEVAAAVAPGAKIVVYFAPNTDQGFIDAISTAVHDTTHNPSVISISWGGPESSWTAQSLNALDAAAQSAAALGVTITVAAGDSGSTDGVTDGQNHVDFPASSPHVLACGGTQLQGSGSTISSEVVWNQLANNEGATGGGVSNVFPLPSWQANANVPPPTVPGGGRGVPDVSGDADPSTGYTIRVDGQTIVIGGTSAVAPLWAGLIALANAQNGKPAGFLQPALYTAKAQSAFNDITAGTNYAGIPTGFAAGPGWDACTGLGSPIGTQIIAAINPAVAAGTTKKGKKKPPPKPPTKTKLTNRK
ncbi:MAG: S53 family peptidase [Acidobacteriota bacterium]|nr:S53 family peptidase [Acidobacteriota bacterium]